MCIVGRSLTVFLLTVVLVRVCVCVRYIVKVTEEQLSSLQVCTSKADVYVRLMVLDQEEEMASAVGKGHAVIPAFIFQKDPAPPGEEGVTHAANPPEQKRSSSRACESFARCDLLVDATTTF